MRVVVCSMWRRRPASRSGHSPARGWSLVYGKVVSGLSRRRDVHARSPRRSYWRPAFPDDATQRRVYGTIFQRNGTLFQVEIQPPNDALLEGRNLANRPHRWSDVVMTFQSRRRRTVSSAGKAATATFADSRGAAVQPPPSHPLHLRRPYTRRPRCLHMRDCRPLYSRLMRS